MLSFKQFIKLQENKLIANVARGIIKGFSSASKNSTTSVPSVGKSPFSAASSATTSVPSVGKSTSSSVSASKTPQSSPDYSKLEKSLKNPENSVAYFQTGSRGAGERPNSLYSLNSQGSTTAYRTPSNAPRGTSPSLQPSSGKTIFVHPEHMDKFATFQGGQSKMRFEPHPDKKGVGRIVHAEDYGPLKAGSPVRGSEEIPFGTRPTMGHHVIEINNPSSSRGIHLSLIHI